MNQNVVFPCFQLLLLVIAILTFSTTLSVDGLLYTFAIAFEEAAEDVDGTGGVVAVAFGCSFFELEGILLASLRRLMMPRVTCKGIKAPF